jgi:ADP-ribose pyrophosphatase YjhB (NUDIX family)
MSDADLAEMPAVCLSYCRRCGGAVRREWMPSESRRRDVCVSCRTIAYDNPSSLVACLVHAEGRLLLARRAIEPAKGRWFLPSGFVESRETLEDATVRELEEEVGLMAQPSVLSLYCVTSLPHMNEIYVIYRAALDRVPQTVAGPETLKIQFFTRRKLPLQELAFRPFTEDFLCRFFDDEERGHFPVRSLIVGASRESFL